MTRSLPLPNPSPQGGGACRTLHWSARYVGVPYVKGGRTLSGLDCWGVPVLVYARERGIALPSYDEVYVSDRERDEIAALVAEGAASPMWQAVRGSGREFDLVVFRYGRFDHHVGLVVGNGRMLHTSEGGQTGIEDYSGRRWVSRLAGIYRHRELMA